MFNKAILIGRFTADPELKQTPSGISVCTFRIGVTRSYAPRGGERQTDFINIVAWRQTAEFVSKYFRKGNPILVEGSIQTRDYTDRDGNRRTAFEVVADNVSFVESKSASSGGNTAPAPAYEPAAAATQPSVSYASGSVGDFEEITSDDDLPF